MTVNLNGKGVLEFSKTDSFTINDATHRAKLLLGMFDQQFPIVVEKDMIINDTEINPTLQYLTTNNTLATMFVERSLSNCTVMAICTEKTYTIEIVGDFVSGTYYNEDQTFQLIGLSANGPATYRIASMEYYAITSAKIIFHESTPSNINPVIESAAAPVLNYGNVLYLTSVQGSSIQTRLNTKELCSLPVLYRVNSFMKAGLPLIINKKGDVQIRNTDAARSIKITLVDWMFKPVILKSPMTIALKIKPISDADIL